MTALPKILLVSAFVLYCASTQMRAAEESSSSTARWDEVKANAWQQRTGWLVGCNYTPSNAINQLEMWQADSFDLRRIDKELAWARRLGFNSVRVFLHHLLWEKDKQGLLERMDQFLEVAHHHGIGVVFVLFDSVWDPHPKLGKQPDPISGLHNSGWVQSPGADDLQNPDRQTLLEAYVRRVISRFKDDERIHAWDLFNEPDNLNDNSYGKDGKKQEPANKVELSLALLKKSFVWARECQPSQPLTSGVWRIDWTKPDQLSPTDRVQLGESDVISFHSYDPLPAFKFAVGELKKLKRPLLCTEYMARPRGSTFETILPYLKEQKIGAYNWGFVEGKTNTIYPWDSWQKKYDKEPDVWFHDIFRPDGKAYDEKEVEAIRGVTQFALNKAFFTTDDGKTWFADDARHVPPYVVNRPGDPNHGKTAYRVQVFKCGDGKPFVSHIEKYSEGDKKKLEAALAKAANKDNALPLMYMSMGSQMLVKKAGTGDEGWVKLEQGKVQEYTKVMQPMCPDGTTNGLQRVNPE